MRSILGYHDVEMALQVTPHIGICILVDRQGSRGMLDKQVQQPHFAVGQFRRLGQNFIGDQVKAPRQRCQFDGVLMPDHDAASGYFCSSSHGCTGTTASSDTSLSKELRK